MNRLLENLASKNGKKILEISKEEFEKLKILGKYEDVFYVRRKSSEILIYSQNVIEGRIYNTYTLNKFGKIGINEFLVKGENVSEKIEEVEIRNLHVTNHERGNHVSLISELREVLAKKERKNIDIVRKEFLINKSSFIDSLVEGKKTLRHIEN